MEPSLRASPALFRESKTEESNTDNLNAGRSTTIGEAWQSHDGCTGFTSRLPMNLHHVSGDIIEQGLCVIHEIASPRPVICEVVLRSEGSAGLNVFAFFRSAGLAMTAMIGRLRTFSC